MGAFAAAFVVLSLGCVGTIEDPPGGGERTPGAAVAKPGPARVWRLDRQEYRNTVRDLLGADPASIESLPPDVGGHGFASEASHNRVALGEAIAYRRIAERLAAELVADDARLASLWPCSLDQLDDDACATRFVETFPRRALRRPLSVEEQTSWLALFRDARERVGSRGAVRLVVETLLQTPSFLHRTEIDMDGHELASALSYALWDTMPDDALLDQAAAGGLGDAVSVETAARGMLADPRARPTLVAFVLAWLEDGEGDAQTRPVESIPDWPAYRDELRASLRRGVESVLAGDARLETLLADDAAFELDDAARDGVLTHPAVLAFHAGSTATSPPRRGRFIAQRLLCREIPDPPAGISIPPRAATGAETTREYFERITARAPCSGCHVLLNPLGFAFEGFDENGRVRENEHGLPIDTAVDLSALPELALARADGAGDLVRALVTSPAVHDCVARQAFRYTLGRRERREDAAYLAEIAARFRASGGDLRELFVAIVASDAFRLREVRP